MKELLIKMVRGLSCLLGDHRFYNGDCGHLRRFYGGDTSRIFMSDD